MAFRGRTAGAAIAGALLLLGGALLILRDRSLPTTETPPAVIANRSLDEAQPAPPHSPTVPDPASSGSRVSAQIEAALASLQLGQTGSATLAELRRALRESDPREAIAAILQFLGTGRDAATGEEFLLGEGGALEGAPTLRLLLMDVLGRLARDAGGTEAAVFARTILQEKKSADEWAISLRNVGWSEPQAKAYLAGKVREMLSYGPWLAAPSAGFLEAFDVAVFIRDVGLVPTLADLLQGERPPLQRAAAVALDRLSEAAPLEVMNYLNGNPAILADRPFVRADHFAKADLAQGAQRHAVETYLARPDVALVEKAKLVKGLATPSSFVSDNLLTPPPAEIDDALRQATIAKTAEEWLTANRFPELRTELLILRERMRP